MKYGGGDYNSYYDAYQGSDCTNFVSQVLYVAGMKHSGGPGSNSKIDGSGCKTTKTSQWYFRKVIDKNSELVSCWSLTWTVAHLQRGVLPTGLNAYLKKIDCRYETGLEFAELLNLEGDRQVKPGDVIQIANGSINYGHSIFVNHVVIVDGKVKDILYSGHTNDAFYESLLSKFNGKSSAKFTVFYTSDYGEN